MAYAPHEIATALAAVLFACYAANVSVTRMTQLVGFPQESLWFIIMRALYSLLWFAGLMLSLGIILGMASHPVILKFFTANGLHAKISLLVMWAFWVLAAVFAALAGSDPDVSISGDEALEAIQDGLQQPQK